MSRELYAALFPDTVSFKSIVQFFFQGFKFNSLRNVPFPSPFPLQMHDLDCSSSSDDPAVLYIEPSSLNEPALDSTLMHSSQKQDQSLALIDSALKVTRLGINHVAQTATHTQDFVQTSESISESCGDSNQIPSSIISINYQNEKESSLEASPTTIVHGIVINSKSGIIEGKLLQREELVPFGIAKLLPSLLKPWRERFAVLDVNRFQMRVWHNSDAFYSDADPLKDIIFTSCMSLSTVKVNNSDGRRILYRFVAIVPNTTQRLSPRSMGDNIGRSTSTEAADIVPESLKVFRFGADSQGAFEIWTVGIRQAIEAAEKAQLQNEDERSAFELGSRLNTSTLLQRALASPTRSSLTSQGRNGGFTTTTTRNVIRSELWQPESSNFPLISQVTSNEKKSNNTVPTFSSTASHIVSAFGTMYSQHASSISLRIHFLDNSCVSLPPLPTTSIAQEICKMVSQLVDLKADADFCLFLRRSGDESSSGYAIFTCVPDLLSLSSLNVEMEYCRGTLVFKRRIYVPRIAMPIPGIDSQVHSRGAGSESGETSRYQSCGDGEPEPLARDSREVQRKKQVSTSSFTNATPPTSFSSYSSVSQIESSQINIGISESPQLQNQLMDAVDAEVDSASSPLEGALRLAFAESIYNVREGLYLLPLKDCLTLAGLQLVCEKNLFRNGGFKRKADTNTSTTITYKDEQLGDNNDEIDLFPPPPLEWYIDRIAYLLPAYAVIEHTLINNKDQFDEIEASHAPFSFHNNIIDHSSHLLSITSRSMFGRTRLAQELCQRHQSVSKLVAHSALLSQRIERHTLAVESEPCETEPVRQQQCNYQQNHIRIRELMTLLAQKCYTQRIRRLSEYGACSFFVGELSREIVSASTGSGSRGASATPIWASSIDQSGSSSNLQKRMKVLVTISHLGIFLRPLPPRHCALISSSSNALNKRTMASSHERDDLAIFPGDPACFDLPSGKPSLWQIHSIQLIEVWGVKKTRPGFVYRVREKKLVNVEISTSAFKEIAGTLHSIVFALMNQREGRPRLIIRDADSVTNSTNQSGNSTCTTRGRQLAHAALAAARDARDTAQSSLPHGWSEIVDPSTGQTAWWNVESRTTVFSRPVI